RRGALLLVPRGRRHRGIRQTSWLWRSRLQARRLPEGLSLRNVQAPAGAEALRQAHDRVPGGTLGRGRGAGARSDRREEDRGRSHCRDRRRRYRASVPSRERGGPAMTRNIALYSLAVMVTLLFSNVVLV